MFKRVHWPQEQHEAYSIVIPFSFTLFTHQLPTWCQFFALLLPLLESSPCRVRGRCAFNSTFKLSIHKQLSNSQNPQKTGGFIFLMVVPCSRNLALFFVVVLDIEHAHLDLHYFSFFFFPSSLCRFIKL